MWFVPQSLKTRLDDGISRLHCTFPLWAREPTANISDHLSCRLDKDSRLPKRSCPAPFKPLPHRPINKTPLANFASAAMDHPLPAPEDDLGHYLSAMVAHAASDLFLSSGTAAAIKVQGVARRLQEAALTAERIQRLAYSVMRESQIRDFESSLECDLTIAKEDWTASA